MPERCDICGTVALESEHFAEEVLPFRPKKAYCPACRQKLYRKLFAALAVLPLLAGVAGLFKALHFHARVLDSIAVQWSLLIVCQWLMILPHELGHAAAGRALGFEQIRILVGSGRAVFSFRLFGIPTLINLIPFGGVTLFKRPSPNPADRWRYLVFVGAGLLANLLAMAVTWSLGEPGALFKLHPGNLLTIFFWSNVAVLAENVFPHTVQTPFGPLNSDGRQLWNLLFRKNEIAESDNMTFWELAMRYMLKWTVFLVMVFGVLFFVLTAAVPIFLERSTSNGWEVRILLPVLMFGFALVAGWAAVRIAQHPVRVSRTQTFQASPWGSISMTPEQEGFLRQAFEYAKKNDFASAESCLDQVLVPEAHTKAPEYWPFVLVKLEFILAQGDPARAEKVCLDWVDHQVRIHEKVNLLDGFACQLLYKSLSSSYHTAERLIRRALELSPGSLTLKGSLGGILVEQGRFAEAEPLLQECLTSSPALFDQGISAFYLGVAKSNTGDLKEAKRLLKRSTVLHPEPWLMAKVEAKLKQIGQ